MATYNLSPIGNEWQFFGAAGANFPPNLPLNGGFLNTFQAGTNTPIATFANNLGSVQNSTTMQLGPDGRFAGAIWLLGGQAYKFQLTDSTGFQIWIIDNIVGVNDTGTGITSEWIASGTTPTYSSATVFTTPGNTTGTFLPGGNAGRRVKATVTAGQVYGSVVSAVFGVSTTVTLSMDTGMILDNGLNAVSVGLLSTNNPSVPSVIPYSVPITQTNNAVGFHAHRAAQQTSGTTVIFDTVDTQSGGTNYSISTGLFTAPYTGWYHFDVSIDSTNSAGGAVTNFFTLSQSGTVVASGAGGQIPAGIEIEGGFGTTVLMTAAQTISVLSNAALSATLTVNGTVRTSFSGFLLQRTA
jgi:hypothetical protein